MAHEDTAPQEPLVCKGTQFDISGTKAKVTAIHKDGVMVLLEGHPKPFNLGFTMIETAVAAQ